MSNYPPQQPQPEQPQQPYAPPPPPPAQAVVPVPIQTVVVAKPTYPGRSQAVASMVLGIVAWGVSFISLGFLSFISLILSLIGLPLAISAWKQVTAARAPRGAATAGLVLNIVGLGIAALFFGFVGMAFLGSAASSTG